MLLRSTTNPEFHIEVDPSVINCCTVLRNADQYAHNPDEVEVDMTQMQLEKFVEFHNHFDGTPITETDIAWTDEFFENMTKRRV
uniref:Uncharacterized protein n=1 Tax=Panagrolaimus sp. PS1159 TaxID=55785 RepID=A0AC35FH54_9BILA